MTESFNTILASAINNHLTLDLIRASSQMHGDAEQIKTGITNFLNSRKVIVAGEAVFIPKNNLLRWSHFAIHLLRCLSSSYRLQFQTAADRVYSLISDSQQLPTSNKKKYLNINYIQNCYRRALKQSKKDQEAIPLTHHTFNHDNIQPEINRKVTVDTAICAKINELTIQQEDIKKEKSELQNSISSIQKKIAETQEKLSETSMVTTENLNVKKKLLQTYETYSAQLKEITENKKGLSQLKTNIKAIQRLKKEFQTLETQIIAEFGKESISKTKSSKVSWESFANTFILIDVQDKINKLEEQLKSQQETQQRQQNLLQELTEKKQRQQALEIQIETLKTSLEIIRKHQFSSAAAKELTAIQTPSVTVDHKSSNFAQTASPIIGPAPKHKPHDLMLLELQKRGLIDLTGVFDTILKKYPNVVHSWTLTHNNEFSLQLKEPIQLWIPSEENPGGVVIQIGANERRTMSGRFVDTITHNSKLDKQTESVIQNALKDPINIEHSGLNRQQMIPKGMKFETGFYFCCHTNNLFIGISDKIQVSYLLELGSDKLLFIAGMLSVSQGRIRDARHYQQQLEKNGKPLLGNISIINFLKTAKASQLEM